MKPKITLHLHYEKKGCFVIGLATQFELQSPFITHYISTPMSVMKIAWVTRNVTQYIYDFTLMQLNTT
jgi:hypothetical protein